MARVFARLKLRLVMNGARQGWQQAAGLIIGTVFAVPLALAGFGLLALTGRGEFASELRVLTFTVVFLGWAVMPVVGFGTDETLDPDRLVLLPLRPRQLMTGMLAASAVGIAPLATLVALTGAVVGAGGVLATVVATAAVAVEFALCICVARALSTSLSALLRSRRARDLGVTLIALLGGAGYFLGQGVTGVAETLDRRALTSAVGVLEWTPPGLAAAAIGDAAEGDLAVAIGELALAALSVLVLAVAWYGALRRSMTRGRPTARGATVGQRLIPALLRWLPSDRRTAVAAKELRYTARDPQRRAQWLSNAMLVVAPVAVGGLTALDDPRVVLLAALVAEAGALQTLYLFSWDRDSLWVNLIAHGDLAHDVQGKVLAAGAVTALLTVAAALALAAFTGGWVYVPAAVALAAAAFAASAGIGTLASVIAPLPVPEPTGSNVWGAANTGQGCATAGYSLLFFALASLATAPIVIAVLLTFRSPARLTVVVAASLVYGGALLAVLLGQAAQRVRQRGPEILQAIKPRT